MGSSEGRCAVGLDLCVSSSCLSFLQKMASILWEMKEIVSISSVIMLQEQHAQSGCELREPSAGNLPPESTGLCFSFRFPGGNRELHTSYCFCTLELRLQSDTWF